MGEHHWTLLTGLCHGLSALYKVERVRRLDLSARILQVGVSVSEGVSDCDSAAHLYELLKPLRCNL